MDVGAVRRSVVDRGLIVRLARHLVFFENLARVEDLACQADRVAELVPISALILSLEVLLLLLLRQLFTPLDLCFFDLPQLIIFVRFLVFVGKKIVIKLVSEQNANLLETEVVGQDLPAVEDKVRVASLSADHTGRPDGLEDLPLCAFKPLTSENLLNFRLHKG